VNVTVLVRVWLPDRPGGLGQVASRIGAVRGDIISVDVLERDGGVAIDEFAVSLASPDYVAMLVREIEQVDGASVEEARIVDHIPDARLDGLDAASQLCESSDPAALHRALSQVVLDKFLADWSVLLHHHRIIVRAGAVPDNDEALAAVAAGATSSPLVITGEAGPADLAVATLLTHRATLLIGRDGHPFRLRERQQLLALAKIADRVWSMVEAPASGLRLRGREPHVLVDQQ
jgi:hypothetical protein